MLQVTLSLPSVRLSVPQSALQSSKVDLKTLAQESVGKHFLRLVTSHGCNLNDPLETLQAAGLQDGDQVTALVGQTKLAFALWCCGGDGIVTWGKPDYGGDSSQAQEQLNVQQLHASSGACATICEAGSVVTWGKPDAVTVFIHLYPSLPEAN